MFTAKTEWQSELNCTWSETDWEKILCILFKLLNATKYRLFQYKINNHILTTNDQRSKWDEDQSPLCQFCDTNIETTLYLLYECRPVKTIWKTLEAWISRRLQVSSKFSPADNIRNLYTGKNHDIVNTTFTVVKQYIYAKKCLNEDISFMGALTKIIDYRQTEGLTAFQKNKMASHYKKWKLFIM